MEETEKTKTQGGKNLTFLGILAVVIALGTTCISMVIYHDSGDIYLDRSRPGYLQPDDGDETPQDDDEKGTSYDFAKQGTVTVESLTEYLNNLNEEIKDIDEYEKPFDMDILSDEHFGIPSE